MSLSYMQLRRLGCHSLANEHSWILSFLGVFGQNLFNGRQHINVDNLDVLKGLVKPVRLHLLYHLYHICALDHLQPQCLFLRSCVAQVALSLAAVDCNK